MDSVRPTLVRRRSLGKDDATMSTVSTTRTLPKQTSSRGLMMTLGKTVSARSLMSSVSTLDDLDEDICIDQLGSFCEDNGYQVSSDVIFRIAFYYNFNLDLAKSAIERSANNEYLQIKMDDILAEQFESGVLYPLPELTLKSDNSSVIYMRPSRYEHSQYLEEMMIQSLCYVLNECSKTEAECRDGVAMVINMDDWSCENFNEDVWLRVMKVLQGDLVPTKVKPVLIVDAPKEFVAMWSSLKKSLLPGFSKNVLMINKSKLSGFLMKGYKTYMPYDCSGCLDPSEIVEDFVDMKTYQLQKLQSARRRASLLQF